MWVTFSKFYIYELSYNSNTVLYQFLETGTSDKTFMGRDQELKWLAFSLYPLSFFLYSPFKVWRIQEWEILVDEKNKTTKVWRIKEWEILVDERN